MPENLPQLTGAVSAMVAACIMPSSDHVASAASPIDLSRLERMRRVVYSHLHSRSLGPDMLCRLRRLRHEFGMNPTDARAASLAGLAPAAVPKARLDPELRKLGECLRLFSARQMLGASPGLRQFEHCQAQFDQPAYRCDQRLQVRVPIPAGNAGDGRTATRR
jgi:hypothetical protein